MHYVSDVFIIILWSCHLGHICTNARITNGKIAYSPLYEFLEIYHKQNEHLAEILSLSYTNDFKLHYLLFHMLQITNDAKLNFHGQTCFWDKTASKHNLHG